MGKLLIIDDERNVRFSLSDVFSDSDMQIQTVATGDDGVRLVAEWAPDAILLDLRLENESGLDVFKRIREVDAKALVIFMTGFGTSEVAI